MKKWLVGGVLLAFLLVATLMAAASMRGLGTFERLLQQSREGTARAMLLSADVQLLAERSITMERAARQFLVLQDQALRTRFDDAARDAEQALGRMSVSGAMTDDVLAWRGQLGRIRGQLRQPEAASAADATLADAFRNLDDLNRRLNLQTRLLIEGQSDHLLTGLEKGRERFARHVLIAFLVSILLALGLGLWLARPLKRLERAVDGLGANLLDQPVVIRGPADVRSLGRRLDWLRLRLRELDADKARFLRHVSHELKTPLASLREGVSLLEDGVAGERLAVDDDLELPAFAVFGQRVAHRLVAGAIAADRRQRGRDVHGLGAHAQVLGQDARACSAVVGGVLFGQDQREDAFGPQGAHGQRAADGTVDAAGDRDHQATAVQLARGDLAQARADAVGFALVVDVEDVVIELAHGLAVCSVSWMRRTLPDAVRGRVSTKVMCRGIL